MLGDKPSHLDALLSEPLLSVTLELSMQNARAQIQDRTLNVITTTRQVAFPGFPWPTGFFRLRQGLVLAQLETKRSLITTDCNLASLPDL